MTKQLEGSTHRKSNKHVVPAPSSPVETLPIPNLTDSPEASPAPVLTTATATPTVSPSATALVDSPPDGAVPTPPKGFIQTSPRQYQGWRPKTAQVAVAGLIVTELETASDYAAQFGGAAPDAMMLANALDVASRWRALRTAADAFQAYARAEDGMAWKAALTMLAQLEPLYAAALTRDASVADTYPALNRWFDIPKAIAQGAAATKKKARKSRAKTEASPVVPAAPVTPAAPASGTTVSGGAAASATPARVVTVTG